MPDLRPAKPLFLRGLFLACALLAGSIARADSLYALPQALLDDQGQVVHLRQWQGKAAIIAMDHSQGNIICSDTTRRLKATQVAADRLQIPIDFIVISLDPQQDTPATWQRYRASQDLTRSNWHFLTASVADTPEIIRQLGVKHWREGEYLIHDLRLLRVDEQGNTVRVLQGYDHDTEAFLR